jgi:hypothetical protein
MVPAMSRRAPVAVLLLTVLFSLPTIAHASPTDPVWIPGFRRVRSGMVAMRAKDMRAKERNE